MCGIMGGWKRDPLPREAIEDALCRLRHRGPDDSGYFESGPTFLGIRRLAIIDVKGGHQPIFNEDGAIAVVLNGEIYNYLELMAGLKAGGHVFRTASDTEVLAHLYEEQGEKMVRELRGMFAFAIWDGIKKQLFVARDRFGKKPLYFSRTNDGGLLFASELKALKPLAAAAGDTWKVRDQAIYDYLSLSVVPQPDTVYEGVRTLPPASWMVFDGDRLSEQCYWRLGYAPTLRLPYAEVLERTRSLVGDAVRLRLRSDVPIGVFLSGGVDSSVVVREAARHLGETLQTFTVSMGHAEFDEAPLAVKTAKMLGVRNTILPLQVSPLEDLQFLVRHYDQPFADSSAIPSYAVSRMARQHLKVVLNGDGGDELFAGYRRYLAANRFDHFRWLPSAAFRLAARCLSACPGGRRSGVGFITRFVRGMGSPPPTRFLVWTTDTFFDTEKRRFWKRSPMRPTEQLIAGCQSESLSVLDAQRAMDLNFILGSTLLVKMDMATMASSLEARSPLLDHVVAEFTAGLPHSYLLRRGRTKAVLRDAYRGEIPSEVIDGKKHGFEIPLVSWLKNELKPVLMDTVGNRNAAVRTYLDGDFVDDILAGKTLSERNWGCLVYALLVLELWLRSE